MIWTRKELKTWAKEALQRNYWKIVLVSFLSLLFCGGLSAGTGWSKGAASDSDTEISAENTDMTDEIAAADTADSTDVADIMEEQDDSVLIGVQKTDAADMTDESQYPVIVPEKARMVAVVLFILIALVALVFLYILQVLLIFPFHVGICRFMIKSIDDRANVKEIAYGFDHSYKNVIKTMFHYDIRIALWYLLFIIPGIYKQYQYRLVPYILAERPDMPYREVLQRSAALMNGHKWKAFLLDLSFIPWHILGIITCFIVEIFYAAPYQALTSAALYRRLSGPEALPQGTSRGIPVTVLPNAELSRTLQQIQSPGLNYCKTLTDIPSDT